MLDIWNRPAPPKEGAEDYVLSALQMEIYVSDLATDEVLYANALTRQRVGDSMLVGKACWRALKQRDGRCEDCPIYILLKTPGKVLKRETEDRRYLVCDNIIPWLGGKFVHLQYRMEL